MPPHASGHHTHDESCGCSRRQFLARSLGCAGFMGLAVAALPVTARRALAAVTLGSPVQSEPWARIDKIADGVWAVVSTPFADPKNPQFKTMANGGIIAGRDGVLVVEGFNHHEGGAWVAQMAEQLTGRKPTHVAVTHFHADHTGGLAGFQRGAEGPEIVATRYTNDKALDEQAAPAQPKEGEPVPDLSPTRRRMLAANRIITDPARTVRIDLGGRVVTLVQRTGHTESDVTVEVEDPRVVFTGDLVFNGMFPYFGDATPSKLSATCERLLTEAGTLYVPGHGPLAQADGMAAYRELLGLVGEAAKAAHKAGTPADKAAQAFTIPERLGDWYKFRPDIFTFAFDAWYRELGAK